MRALAVLWLAAARGQLLPGAAPPGGSLARFAAVRPPPRPGPRRADGTPASARRGHKPGEQPHRRDVARLRAAPCTVTAPAETGALAAAVAALRFDGDGDAVVCLAAGTHVVEETILIGGDPARRGWLALRGEPGAVVSGGAALEGWRRAGPGTWTRALKRSPPRVLFDEARGRRVPRTSFPQTSLTKPHPNATLFLPSANASAFEDVEFVWTGARPRGIRIFDFNVSVCDSFDATSSAVLREIDESNRFVQKSAESTWI
jgi:hypothetical protein